VLDGVLWVAHFPSRIRVVQFRVRTLVQARDTSRLALRPPQPSVLWVTEALSPRVKPPGHKPNQSPPSSAKVKNERSCTTIPLAFAFTNQQCSLRSLAFHIFSRDIECCRRKCSRYVLMTEPQRKDQHFILTRLGERNASRKTVTIKKGKAFPLQA
jgi:hypothetical protein